MSESKKKLPKESNDMIDEQDLKNNIKSNNSSEEEGEFYSNSDLENIDNENEADRLTHIKSSHDLSAKEIKDKIEYDNEEDPFLVVNKCILIFFMVLLF